MTCSPNEEGKYVDELSMCEICGRTRDVHHYVFAREDKPLVFEQKSEHFICGVCESLVIDGIHAALSIFSRKKDDDKCSDGCSSLCGKTEKDD